MAPNSAPWRLEETHVLALHMLRVIRGGADLALARPLPPYSLWGHSDDSHAPPFWSRVRAIPSQKEYTLFVVQSSKI